MMTTFHGNKLKTARLRRGWTVSSLHIALVRRGMNVTPQAIYSWEKGEYVPSSRYLPILAEVLGKPIGYFFDLKRKQSAVCVTRDGGRSNR